MAKGRLRSPMAEMPFACPVNALDDWLTAAEISKGPFFCKVHSHGKIYEDALVRTSVNKMMRQYLGGARVNATLYSSHSMHRELTNFLIAQEMPDKEIMNYVGWSSLVTLQRYKDPHGNSAATALQRYIDVKMKGGNIRQMLMR